MPCFNPKDVIFVINKWDNIRKSGNKKKNEEYKLEVWKKLKRMIKENWKEVKEENMFRLNLIEVCVCVWGGGGTCVCACMHINTF